MGLCLSHGHDVVRPKSQIFKMDDFVVGESTAILVQKVQFVLFLCDGIFERFSALSDFFGCFASSVFPMLISFLFGGTTFLCR